MKLAAYIRVSSDKQDVTRQRENIESWAVRHGAVPVWFEDSDGKNPRHRADKRQNFQTLLKSVQAGRFERIIVDSQDRFGTKDAYEWGKFISLLRDHGCELIDSQGRLLSGDDDGAVLTGVVGALTSKREQREKAHRNISGKITYAKKGEYQGGYAPYGTDVVCFGTNGREKWRTVYIGHLDRLKVYPDGKQERFTGKNVTPTKDTTDTLRLRPSREKERLKIVKQIFNWYVTEDVSPQGIADRLNGLQVPPVFSEYWYKHTVRAILSNPIYIGLPTWNKRSNAAFVEYVDGRLQEITGKARPKRRTSADYVQPEAPEFAPIVPVETFNKVQQKLAATSQKANKGRRSPKLAELWLRPFLYCGHCGEVMHAAGGGGTTRLKPSYFCSTYNKYGPRNPQGCHCHRVRHEVLEELVVRYLKETAPKVAQLLQASDTGDVESVRSLLSKGRFLEQEYADVACDVITYVEEHATTKERARIGEGFDVVFGLAFERIRPKLEKTIEAKEAELDAMLDDYRTLPERLKARAVAKMEPLEVEITELRQRLVDLRKPFQGIRAELEARKAALETAEQEIAREGAGRRKGEVLRGVVERIVCYFQHSEGKQHNGKSRLDRVEIVPISGDSVCFRNGDMPGPG